MENPKDIQFDDNHRSNKARVASMTKKVAKNNKSGVKGVHYDLSKQKYVAHIGFKGKDIRLGAFKNKEDAIAARKAAEEKYWKPVIEKCAKVKPTQTLRQKHQSIYWCWKAIKQRCLNPKCKAYHNYGGRGIGICEEWMEFEPFCEWALHNGFKEGLDIDRIDNDGDYTPDNCRWTTRVENANNRRETIYLTYNGETKAASIWAREYGIPIKVPSIWHHTHGREYAEKRLVDAIENGYTEKNYSYGHKKPVIHKETGERFESIKEAAQCLHISESSISMSANHNKPTAKGTFAFEQTSRRGNKSKGA